MVTENTCISLHGRHFSKAKVFKNNIEVTNYKNRISRLAKPKKTQIITVVWKTVFSGTIHYCKPFFSVVLVYSV